MGEGGGPWEDGRVADGKLSHGGMWRGLADSKGKMQRDPLNCFFSLYSKTLQILCSSPISS